MSNVNGHKPITTMRGPAGAIVGQGQELDMRKCIKDASRLAGELVAEMRTQGELAAGLEVATYQVAMQMLLEPIKAGIQISAQVQAQQAMMRAQGILG